MKKVEPMFPLTDLRQRIPLMDVARKLGYKEGVMRIYAKEGTIPGASRVGPRKRWFFDRQILETWWAEKNGNPPP